MIGSFMAFNKTEVNLRRLLAAAPQQKNQAKLIHYVATLRELLEQLVAGTTPDGLPSISKAKMNDYSEKIEAIASKLAAPSAVDKIKVEESPPGMEEVGTHKPTSPGLRRRIPPHTRVEDRPLESDSLTPVKLDALAQAQIERHRKLQEDLTDEMVELAQQLKESSLTMNRSLKDTEKRFENTKSDSNLMRIQQINSKLRRPPDCVLSSSMKTNFHPLIRVLSESRYLILQKGPWNIAWRAPVVPTSGPWRYTQRASRLLATHGS